MSKKILSVECFKIEKTKGKVNVIFVIPNKENGKPQPDTGNIVVDTVCNFLFTDTENIDDFFPGNSYMIEIS